LIQVSLLFCNLQQLIPNELRTAIQNIIQGTGSENSVDSCSQVWNHLIKSFGSSQTSTKGFEGKKLRKEE